MDWVVLLLLLLLLIPHSFGCCCITISGFSLFGLVLVQVSARKFPLEAINLSCQPLMMSLFWKLSVSVLETLVCHFLWTKEEVLVFGVCALTTWYFWIVKFEGMNNGHKPIHGVSFMGLWGVSCCSDPELHLKFAVLFVCSFSFVFCEWEEKTDGFFVPGIWNRNVCETPKTAWIFLEPFLFSHTCTDRGQEPHVHKVVEKTTSSRVCYFWIFYIFSCCRLSVQKGTYCFSGRQSNYKMKVKVSSSFFILLKESFLFSF